MWIIPKNHSLASVFAQDMVESKKDLSELSESLGSSLMWRSKPSQLRTWLIRWKRGGWFRHLSGRMLKPSQWSCLEGALMFSALDTLVSPSVPQGNDLEEKTHDIYGHTSPGLSMSSDQDSLSLKMSKDTFLKDLERCWRDYDISDTEWARVVKAKRGEYSARLRSAQLIKEKESSSSVNWPTPAARDYKGSNAPDRTLEKLQQGQRAQLGQLPNAVMMSGPQDQANNNIAGRSQGLSSWQTPRVGGSYCDCPGERRRNSPSLHSQCRGKLNPDWVEQLMGLPVGWTQLSDAEHDDNRVDRLRLIGNGVVPQTAERAIANIISGKEIESDSSKQLKLF